NSAEEAVAAEQGCRAAEARDEADRALKLRLLLLVFEHDVFGENFRQCGEIAVDDSVGESGASLEVVVRWRFARKLTGEILAEEVRGVGIHLVLLLVGPEGADDNGDRVLNSLRHVSNSALPVCQLELVLDHGVAQFER